MTQPDADPTVSMPGTDNTAFLAWLDTAAAARTAERVVEGLVIPSRRVEGFGRAVTNAISVTVRAATDPAGSDLSDYCGPVWSATLTVTDRYYGSRGRMFALACLQDLSRAYSRTLAPAAVRD